jgi:hypothetical protein
MKNKLIISFLILLFPVLAFSQRKYYEPEYYLGVTGGVTGSMVYFKPKVSQTYLLGNTGGLIFRYIGAKHYGLQVEANYLQRGWQEKKDLYARRLDYLEVPFMTHFNWGKSVRFHFNLGLQGSFLLGEKVVQNNTENSTDVQHNLPVQNKFDYGFCGGLGLTGNIKGQVIQLDVRASYGVNNIFSNAPKDHFSYSSNLNAAVTLGWLMQFKNGKLKVEN